MSKTLARLWNDDEGAIISVELILVIALLVFGIIPGLVALRNSVVAALVNVGNTINALSTMVIDFDGIGVNAGPTTASTGIAFVGGISINQTVDPGMTTSNTDPVANTIAVAPATPAGKLISFP